MTLRVSANKHDVGHFWVYFGKNLLVSQLLKHHADFQYSECEVYLVFTDLLIGVNFLHIWGSMKCALNKGKRATTTIVLPAYTKLTFLV